MQFVYMYVYRGIERLSLIGSLKAGFMTERSKPGSCRAFRIQYPILIGSEEEEEEFNQRS